MEGKYLSGSEDFKHKQLEAGLLGRFLGTGNNIIKNSISIIAIILTLGIILLVFLSDNVENTIEIIKIISPLLTLAIGYLAGVKS